MAGGFLQIAIRGSATSFPWRFCRQALVFLLVKAGNDRIAGHQSRQGTTVEHVRKNTQIFGIGANVPFFEGDPARSQECLRLDARATTGFRVEVNLHLQKIPTVGPGSPCIRKNRTGAIKFTVQVVHMCKRGNRLGGRLETQITRRPERPRDRFARRAERGTLRRQSRRQWSAEWRG